jgi:hypothetical protein
MLPRTYAEQKAHEKWRAAWEKPTPDLPEAVAEAPAEEIAAAA